MSRLLLLVAATAEALVPGGPLLIQRQQRTPVSVQANEPAERWNAYFAEATAQVQAGTFNRPKTTASANAPTAVASATDEPATTAGESGASTLPSFVADGLAGLALTDPTTLSQAEQDVVVGSAVVGALTIFLLPLVDNIFTDFAISSILGGGLLGYLSLRQVMAPPHCCLLR